MDTITQHQDKNQVQFMPREESRKSLKSGGVPAKAWQESFQAEKQRKVLQAKETRVGGWVRGLTKYGWRAPGSSVRSCSPSAAKRHN